MVSRDVITKDGFRRWLDSLPDNQNVGDSRRILYSPLGYYVSNLMRVPESTVFITTSQIRVADEGQGGMSDTLRVVTPQWAGQHIAEANGFMNRLDLHHLTVSDVRLLLG